MSPNTPPISAAHRLGDPKPRGAVERRWLLKVGALATMLTGTSAITAPAARAETTAENPTRDFPCASTTVKDFGAVGDGMADDTAACQEAITTSAGGVVRLTPGTYKVNQLTLPSNTTLIIDAGAVVLHTTKGAVFKASGIQDARRTVLTEASNRGSSEVTAPGHGLIAGDTFRLASEASFDAFSTDSKYGELCVAQAVSGDVISTAAPISGASYAVSDTAYVQKITPVSNINILGPGTIRGLRSPALGQYGIDVLMGKDVLISGLKIENVDRRHVYFSDCTNAWVEHCRLSWAIDSTMGYGISVANASQDCGARFNDIDYVRHGFTTNNETAWPGIPRRILFSHNTVRSTSRALGGSMGGGDAIDTHTAAEDIWIEHNAVLSSSGQGINFEARSGHIVGNKVSSAVSTGISVHNESDLPGRISVTGNEVCGSGGAGIQVRSGGRGTKARYEYINVSHNVVADTGGSGVVIGSASAIGGPERGVTAIGNTAIRSGGSYALLIINASGVSAAHNKGIDGATSVSVTDLASSIGDDPGYVYSVISSDEVTVTPLARYVVVDTEARAPSDSLTRIIGGAKGQIITLRTFANARDVAIAGTGNIRTTSPFTLDAARDSITLGFDGTYWVEQSRADFPSA
ncbi:glycosyl hydrolase family 28-related protein [Pseudarthrobacter sp. BIM B-2242]|uniref:glycosyl hydrolase family 28-related protein n=1 Tax=Pseudarthrobacter sp. BIM B-2242 TaxID=2772401 RepID=UPI00168B96C2|nr:glycosyl hydrolase family 28-related protein [Pseudarthrobacter sp. BIM B-2242]QOD05805.1 right-handed parallel beta-helix repeat-containing protein [Pseudarthrobacter sp. BIM B-2242]